MKRHLAISLLMLSGLSAADHAQHEPPQENRLPIPIRAGERNFRGGHE